MCHTSSCRHQTCDAHAKLTAQEWDVLRVLVRSHNRVIGRRELSRRIGLSDVGERRCDSLLVGIRKVLGADSIRTVRGRGWILSPQALPEARELLEGEP